MLLWPPVVALRRRRSLHPCSMNVFFFCTLTHDLVVLALHWETTRASPGCLAPHRGTSLLGWCTLCCARSIIVTVGVYRSETRGRRSQNSGFQGFPWFLFTSVFSAATSPSFWGHWTWERRLCCVSPWSQNLSSRVSVTALSLLAGLPVYTRDALEAETDSGHVSFVLVLASMAQNPTCDRFETKKKWEKNRAT